eukprot:scaffold10191_cov108-Isochrysis_galbana.AAC.8
MCERALLLCPLLLRREAPMLFAIVLVVLGQVVAHCAIPQHGAAQTVKRAHVSPVLRIGGTDLLRCDAALGDQVDADPARVPLTPLRGSEPWVPAKCPRPRGSQLESAAVVGA